jgi:hypothetical protein
VKRIIVRAYAIIASFVALFAPGAFALPIDTGIIGNTPGASAPGNGFVQAIDCSVPAGIDGFGTRTIGSGSMMLNPVAAGLFSGSSGEGGVQNWYMDPSTLCVTASGIEATGSLGLMSDERICRSEEPGTPMPVPGTMLVVGLGLLGLSSLKRRGQRAIPPARKAARSEDSRFFPARVLAAEARAAEGKARVVPISAALNQRTAPKETEKYRAVMKRKHQSQDLRKEMAG